MTTVLHPKGWRVTVLRDRKETKTEGGLEIPENVTLTDHCVGTVLEVGPEIIEKFCGRHQAADEVMAMLEGRLKPDINPGDRVLYSRFAGIDATVGGKSICILNHHPDHDEIIGVLEGEGE